jgi:predicted O-methyltransferase YrrM
MKIARVLNTGLQHLLAKLFPFFQRLGIHVTPISFYQPIPDTRTLKDDLWVRRSEMIGMDMNEAGQLDLLARFVAQFKDEYERLPRTRTPTPHQYYVNNGTFESVDGEILYCMIRHFKPRKIFEIGSGNSTFLSAQAVLKNKGEDGVAGELVAFEPYPNRVLRAGFPGLSRLVETRIQEVPLSEFDKLADGDILFIDSSHVLKIGSDVHYEYLDVLPRLRTGVIVHIHDIFLPAEYPKDLVLKARNFWNEQYLLQAFLAFNESFEILWAGSYMHLKHPDELASAFSSYERSKTWPGSFWLRRVK